MKNSGAKCSTFSAGGPAVLRIILLVLTTPASPVAAFQSSTNTAPEEFLLRAQQAQTAGDYKAAAAAYRAFLKVRPGVPEVQANQGLMEFMAGQYTDAKQSLESALHDNPGLLSANLFLGLDLLKLHQPEQALRYLQIADKTEPGNPTIMLGLGEAYAGVQQLEKADEIYEEVLRVHPRNLDALYGLGTTSLSLQEEVAQRLANLRNNSPYAEILLAEAFILQQRASDAARICEKLLAAYSAFQGLHTVLGFADLQLGRWRAAEDAFRSELKNSPGYLPAQLGSAGLDLLQGSVGKGLKELEEIRETDSNFLDSHAGQLWAALTSDQFSGLQGELKNVPAVSGESAIANDLLQNMNSPGAIAAPGAPRKLESRSTHLSGSAAQLYAAGQYTACTERIAGTPGLPDRGDLMIMMPCSYYAGDYWTTFVSSSGILARDPGNLQALFWLSKAAMKLALGALTQAGSIDPNAYRMHVLQAETYGVMRQYENAEAEYRKAIQLRPEDLAAHLGLGTIYWRQMKFDAAEPELSLVLAANPSDAQAGYMMGNVLMTRHQFERAEPLLKSGVHAAGESGLRAHEALGKAYLSTGRTLEAITELRQALPADRDGSIHFQLYLAYRKTGDASSAMAALRESELLRKRREASAAEKLSLAQ
jgi:tetratricopeptide (TPR) repeat protein